MPRYFFNLRNDLSVNDEEGQELPDLDAAHEAARKFALDMAAVSVAEHQHLNLHHRIEVVDEAGKSVMVVEFGDVVAVES
jgi:hypothetical protein